MNDKMLGSDKAEHKNTFSSNPTKARLLLYVSITAIIVLLAISTTIESKGSQLQRCLNVVVAQNKYSCLESLALSTSNGSICSYLPGLQSASCYSSVAEQSNAISLCYNALGISSAIGASCVSEFAAQQGNPNLCSSLPQQYVSKCAFYASINSSDVHGCSLVSGANNSICVSSINVINALKYNNPALCMNVSNSTNETTIFSILQYSKVKMNASLESLQISMPSSGYNITARDLCTISVAEKSGAASYCSGISNSEIKGICYGLVSPAPVTAPNYTAMLASCESSGSFAGTCRNMVLLSEAVATKNISICRGFNETFSWQCFSSLAQYYKNPSYCGFISNSTVNNACMMSAGYNLTVG
ncbi:MAG: hypothetical protein ACP5RF_00035 [Candidatus Micrarchaeia archaeon]